MPFFRKNIISNQVIKAKSDRIQKRALRDTRKRIKNNELADSHGLALYLPTIDARFAHIKADIKNATRVANYSKVRADKIAETRELLDFFSQDHSELSRLYQIVFKKAQEAERIAELKEEKLSSVDLTKLKASFDKLIDEEK